MRVQKLYVRIIRYVNKDGRGTYIQYKNLVNAIIRLGDIKPGNKRVDKWWLTLCTKQN